MGIFDRFPYSSTHEMNLDFMLGKATEIAESLQEIDTHKEQAEQAATNAAQSAQSAAQAAQAAAGSQTAAGTSASQAAQHKADAEDAADRAEAASDLADEAVEQAQAAATTAGTAAQNASTAAQNASTAADGAIASATAAETRINNLAASLPEDFTELNNEVTDFKSALFQEVTIQIPSSFNPATSKANLSLTGYAGKKVFVSNRNLLPQFTQMTDHGITCTKNADGSITLSGTANGAASIAITINEMPNIGPGTYTLSCGNPVAMGDSDTYINVEIDGTYAPIYARFNEIAGNTSFIVPEGSRVTGIRIRISSGVAAPSNFKCYPQITEGEEVINFIKHEGSILNTTNGTINNVDVYTGYTYICAQAGVSGTVTYLEESPSITKKFIGKKIVCFGDSITGNFIAPADYPSMIAEITGATVYNAGFGGCCMSDNGQTRRLFTMCRLVDSIVTGDFSAQRNSGVSITYAGTSVDYVPERLTMLESIDWSEIDCITIAYGTNDWNSNYGLDNDSNPLDTTTYIGAFRYSVENLLAKYPNIKIMVITPLWRWWDTNTGMPSEIQADYIDSDTYAKGTGYKLWQYGDALVEASKWYHIPVFDLYWNCMMTKQNRLEYFNATDGTHPKLKGRELMAELISAHIESVY